MKSIKEIYKIGHGPSSSHTLGPKIAAEYVLNKYSDADYYEVTLYGSLALTGKGHLTDYIIYETLKDKCKVIFDYSFDSEHPNTLIFKVYKNKELVGEEVVYSIGGGFIKIKGVEEEESLDIYKETTFDTIKKYVKDPELIKRAIDLNKKGKRCHPLIYKGDMSLQRRFYIYAQLLNYFRKYKKYN